MSSIESIRTLSNLGSAEHMPILVAISDSICTTTRPLSSNTRVEYYKYYDYHDYSTTVNLRTICNPASQETSISELDFARKDG